MSNLKKDQLTKNFNLSEFVQTATGIENIPGPVEINNLKALAVNVLQPARNAVAKSFPGAQIIWKITSGYRSQLVNAAVGGSTTSQHPKGEASDNQVFVNGVQLSNLELIGIIRASGIPFDQMIDEELKGKKWVHLSYSQSRQRRQLMTARDGANGETVYKTISGPLS